MELLTLMEMVTATAVKDKDEVFIEAGLTVTNFPVF